MEPWLLWILGCLGSFVTLEILLVLGLDGGSADFFGQVNTQNLTGTNNTLDIIVNQSTL